MLGHDITRISLSKLVFYTGERECESMCFGENNRQWWKLSHNEESFTVVLKATHRTSLQQPTNLLQRSDTVIKVLTKNGFPRTSDWKKPFCHLVKISMHGRQLDFTLICKDKDSNLCLNETSSNQDIRCFLWDMKEPQNSPLTSWSSFVAVCLLWFDLAWFQFLAFSLFLSKHLHNHFLL